MRRRVAYGGMTMAIGAMCCVQLGAAASVSLAHRLGAEGVAWLRLMFAGVLLGGFVRPWRGAVDRQELWLCAQLGLTTAAMSLLFIAAIVRLPLGTASALEFLGPLGVAIVHSRSRGWPFLAAAGVVLLTDPWHATSTVGLVFALGAACCWAAYILLTQRAGDKLAGLQALAISMPIAAIAATLVAAPVAAGKLTWEFVPIGLGLALLMPTIPFSLELLALRRLTAGAFGTLMSFEPAIALAIGFVVLHQHIRSAAIVGVFLVVVAGTGVARSGARLVTDELASSVRSEASV